MTERPGTRRDGDFEFKLYDCRSAGVGDWKPGERLCEDTTRWVLVPTQRVTESDDPEDKPLVYIRV